MMFLTVGTQFHFDRLVRSVDEAVERCVIKDEIFAQIGDSSYKPRNFEAVCFLDKKDYDEKFCCAAAVVSHAGMGTIAAAMELRKPMLAMPRLKKYGEAVNDHQLHLARRFENEGYLLAAYEAKEIPEKMAVLNSFVPQFRQQQAEAVAQRIRVFLDQMNLKE